MIPSPLSFPPPIKNPGKLLPGVSLINPGPAQGGKREVLATC
jgi:hypothetical protein